MEHPGFTPRLASAISRFEIAGPKRRKKRAALVNGGPRLVMTGKFFFFLLSFFALLSQVHVSPARFMGGIPQPLPIFFMYHCRFPAKSLQASSPPPAAGGAG